MEYYITKYILKYCSSNFTNIIYNTGNLTIEQFHKLIPFYKIILEYYLEYINLVNNFEIEINPINCEIKIKINDVCWIIVDYSYCYKNDYDHKILSLFIHHELWLKVKGDCRFHYPTIQQKDIITNKQIINLFNKNLYDFRF